MSKSPTYPISDEAIDALGLVMRFLERNSYATKRGVDPNEFIEYILLVTSEVLMGVTQSKRSLRGRYGFNGCYLLMRDVVRALMWANADKEYQLCRERYAGTRAPERRIGARGLELTGDGISDEIMMRRRRHRYDVACAARDNCKRPDQHPELTVLLFDYAELVVAGAAAGAI